MEALKKADMVLRLSENFYNSQKELLMSVGSHFVGQLETQAVDMAILHHGLRHAERRQQNWEGPSSSKKLRLSSDESLGGSSTTSLSSTSSSESESDNPSSPVERLSRKLPKPTSQIKELSPPATPASVNHDAIFPSVKEDSYDGSKLITTDSSSSLSFFLNQAVTAAIGEQGLSQTDSFP